VCNENLRTRQPAITWSSAAADSHAKDVSALRENLISCAKGRTINLSDFVHVVVSNPRNRRDSGLAHSIDQRQNRQPHGCNQRRTVQALQEVAAAAVDFVVVALVVETLISSSHLRSVLQGP
jgi:hypothetical protein